MNDRTSTVFLVDDDEDVRRALTRQIRSAGYCVESFESAMEFPGSRPRSQGCASLVLDVGLPGLNGLELQDKMNAVNRPMPIIFITGRGDISMTVRAMKAGASDFLTKPVSNSDLLRAIVR
jgi:FixJ family two-component response regulator